MEQEATVSRAMAFAPAGTRGTRGTRGPRTSADQQGEHEASAGSTAWVRLLFAVSGEPADATEPASPASALADRPRRPLSSGVATVSLTTSYTPHKNLVLGLGTRGAGVRQLQRALGGVAVDGVFGELTRDRVVALQRSMAQPPTGIVTPELWDVLEAREFPFVAHRSTVLREGDSGPAVLAVQRLLGVAMTGVFDEVTRRAVKAAQARAGLASTGVVASRTWSLFDRLSA